MSILSETKQNLIIENYKIQLNSLKNSCLELNTEIELKELFKGIIILFIKDIILLYNKLIIKLPELRYSNSSEKITNLNILLNALESDGKLYNLNCNDIIMRAYVNYFYQNYRNEIIEWNLEQIKLINETNITEAILESAEKENQTSEIIEHLNIIPEIVLMINNLNTKDILKILYILNNLNIIIDVYLYKKHII